MDTTGPAAVPPQRFDIDELLIRRWRHDDLTAQYEAILASHEHLHPWMPWAAAEPSLERQRAFIADAAANPPDGRGDHFYGIFDHDGAVLGGIGLHHRSEPGTAEIGYWCHVDHTGRGVITRAVAALTGIALNLPGIRRVEIRCDEANVRSAAVPRRLGYRLDRIETRAPTAPAESGRVMVWQTTRDRTSNS
ncbi:GNAT family N-acetyltransferase [Nocardia arizonensis]|uniref:GNAT family N-acetyltransferase n=1 Tax=Nocardia arizonensis TaxID=1141647 RepID=UPI0009E8405E|nr:GNAT family N-acetyltransferase [Nocardia arizonensis]